MMDFFNNCTTKEEVKELFRKLSKHFHPDKGGDVNLMIELKSQYDQWPNHASTQKTYQKPISPGRPNDWDENLFEARNQLDRYDKEITRLRLEIHYFSTSMIQQEEEKKKLKHYISLLERGIEEKNKQVADLKNLLKKSQEEKPSFFGSIFGFFFKEKHT